MLLYLSGSAKQVKNNNVLLLISTGSFDITRKYPRHIALLTANR